MNSRIIFSTTQNFDVFAPNVFICINFSYFKSYMVFYHMGMPWLHPCHWIFKLFQLFNIIEFRRNILTDTHLYTQPPWFSHILFFWKSHPWHWAHPSLMVPWVLIVSSLWETLASPVSLLCTLSLALLMCSILLLYIQSPSYFSPDVIYHLQKYQAWKMQKWNAH